MQYVDVLIGNEEDAVTVFGLDAPDIDVKRGKLELETYREIAEQLVHRFAFSHVATTLRRSLSASINHWSGTVYDGQSHYASGTYEIYPVVDRVGGGDAFAGGLIYGLLQAWPLQRTVEFAAAASCLKHSIAGDFGLVTHDEIELLVGGDASGRIVR